MSKGNRNRQLRKQAREEAVADGYTNINIKMIAVKSGKRVIGGDGVVVDELVPHTTFMTVHKPFSYKAIYKGSKV